MDYWILFFLGGVAVGWITKVPFLIKWYRELRERHEDMRRLADHASKKWSEIYQKEKELKSLKYSNE